MSVGPPGRSAVADPEIVSFPGWASIRGPFSPTRCSWPFAAKTTTATGSPESVVDRGGRGVVAAADAMDALPLSRWGDAGVACLEVADTTQALGDMAAFHRVRCAVPVVAVTGSNGKTTTRALTAAVLAQAFCTWATQGNFNNQIGVPLTLLGLCPDHQWAVVEMGMNHPGEIQRLAAICAPRIGVITNVAPAHLEGLGSVEAVMAAKGELLEQIEDGGVAVLHADDPWSRRLAQRHGGRRILFGFGPDAEIRATDVRTGSGGTRFVLHLPGGRITVRLGIPGRFMVANALAAAAVATALDLPPETIRRGLEGVAAVSGRMRLKPTTGGATVIDDTYNANPASMAAALETLADLGRGHRRAVVLGSMAELGDQSEDLHRQVGRQAAETAPERLYLTGPMADAMAAGARDGGMADADTVCAGRQEIIEDLKQWIAPGDWILVKGSRSMAMETVVGGHHRPDGRNRTDAKGVNAHQCSTTSYIRSTAPSRCSTCSGTSRSGPSTRA